jgi:hypothetical protein
MSDFPTEDMVATERAALVGWWLADGFELTTTEIANRVGLRYKSAWRMMNMIARVVGICLDEEGRWYRIMPR